MDGKIDEETQQRINDGDWLCVDSQYVNIYLFISLFITFKLQNELLIAMFLFYFFSNFITKHNLFLFRCGNINFARRNSCNRCGKGTQKLSFHCTYQLSYLKLFFLIILDSTYRPRWMFEKKKIGPRNWKSCCWKVQGLI